MFRRAHNEKHYSHRVGWLRAAVLGANDGIISIACLLLGVAAAQAGREQLLTAGIAALVAGAMSMAAGEYVSVSSQADAEHADLAIESEELRTQPDAELHELTHIYIKRGVSSDLARQVAEQLTAHDALLAHARDELGIHDAGRAQPLQAAITSAITFGAGAALPVITAMLVPASMLISSLALTSLIFLIILGSLAAAAGGAPIMRAAVRVGVWGAVAMAVTAGVGHLFGTVV
ncbi:VIT family protein [uncultured Oxalicibacterium sp.]|uniref:VIT1/CCC1 transporter family protein n=1 Tax=uncultured Oxalicibacterium sp. TaxID=1168540 RepID=UPI0025E619CF|nr:VIT family protein [uncultured Oxalicibacterium sp.]